VYEYCRPIIYEDRVICVVYIGNILTQDPAQRKKLETRVGCDLLETMGRAFSPEDCVKTADILESYIVFLFSHYGIENKTFDPLVENIKGFLRENMTYDFTMEELASAFNYTPKYLGRIFKLRTGKTIKDYCNHAKVQLAKTLLTETANSVEAVAVQVGFNSVNYFDRVFRKITGLSPQAYRSAAKKA
jgi:YesN/AraC family two-component response regulator